VTLIILSLGIVGIFRTFIFSLDRMRYLTNRLYASMILDNHVITIERMLRAYKALPTDLEPWEGLDTGLKERNYRQKMNISQVDDLNDIFQLDLSISWMEGGHEVRLQRSSYISDLGLAY